MYIIFLILNLFLFLNGQITRMSLILFTSVLFCYKLQFSQCLRQTHSSICPLCQKLNIPPHSPQICFPSFFFSGLMSDVIIYIAKGGLQFFQYLFMYEFFKHLMFITFPRYGSRCCKHIDG